VSLTSLLISITAVAVSGASAWYSHSQIVEMRRQFEQSGPRVEVSSNVGVPMNLGTSRVQSGVTATNKGRGSASIQNWGFMMDSLEGDGGLIFGSMYSIAFGPKVPCTIEGLSSESWFMDRAGLREAVANCKGTNVRPFVDLGDGQRIQGATIEVK